MDGRVRRRAPGRRGGSSSARLTKLWQRASGRNGAAGLLHARLHPAPARLLLLRPRRCLKTLSIALTSSHLAQIILSNTTPLNRYSIIGTGVVRPGTHWRVLQRLGLCGDPAQAQIRSSTKIQEENTH